MAREVHGRGATKAGSPLQGQGPALDLVATLHIRGGLRGRLEDDLESPDDLDLWLRAQPQLMELGPLKAATNPDLSRVRELREAIRFVLEARFGSAGPVADRSRELLNSAADLAHEQWVLDSDLTTLHRSYEAKEPLDVILAAIARDALRVLSDTQGRLRRCPAPACILYFWDETGRRRWCSTTCGTRVRVARHAAGGN